MGSLNDTFWLQEHLDNDHLYSWKHVKKKINIPADIDQIIIIWRIYGKFPAWLNSFL